MLDKDLLARFWKDFHLTTQDEDTSFPIANPQDAARVLVKCRNWVGTFTEESIKLINARAITMKALKNARRIVYSIESTYYNELLREGTSISILKTKELAHGLIANKAAGDPSYSKHLLDVLSLEDELNTLDTEKEICDSLLKRIEKTTDYLVQYLNWVKYEVRTLQ